MSQIAQQLIPVNFADPDNIGETFVNGPMNLNITGMIATMTFTVIRGDLQEMMTGQQMSKVTANVALRLVMPLETLLQTKTVLSQVVLDQPPTIPDATAPGSNLKQ